MAITATFLLLLTVAAASYHYQTWPFQNKKADSYSIDEQIKAGTEIKKQSIDNTTSNNKAQSGSDVPIEPQVISGSDKKSVNFDITSVNQDGENLVIRTLIQAIVSSGTCNLTMSNDQGGKYTSTAEVQPLPSSSTCKGFNVPINQLTQGEWNIVIEFSNNELFTSASKKVDIK